METIRRTKNGLSDKEKVEFSNLKEIRAENGFWTKDEQERYFLLWDINAAGVLEALDKHNQLFNQIGNN